MRPYAASTNRIEYNDKIYIRAQCHWRCGAHKDPDSNGGGPENAFRRATVRGCSRSPSPDTRQARGPGAHGKLMGLVPMGGPHGTSPVLCGSPCLGRPWGPTVGLDQGTVTAIWAWRPHGCTPAGIANRGVFHTGVPFPRGTLRPRPKVGGQGPTQIRGPGCRTIVARWYGAFSKILNSKRATSRIYMLDGSMCRQNISRDMTPSKEESKYG